MGVDNLTENDLNFLGATTYPEEGRYSQKMNYFLVPALIKYKFKFNMYVEAGPQFGLMYKSWIQYDSDIDELDATIKEYNKDLINKIDAGIMIGLGYTMFKGTGWTFGVKYYEGFVNVYKDRPGTRNRSFFLKLNIPIGAGDKSKIPKKDKSNFFILRCLRSRHNKSLMAMPVLKLHPILTAGR